MYEKVKQHLNLTPDILLRDQITPAGTLKGKQDDAARQQNAAKGKKRAGQQELHSAFFQFAKMGKVKENYIREEIKKLKNKRFKRENKQLLMLLSGQQSSRDNK